MKQDIQLKFTMRQRLDALIDALIEAIVDFEDILVGKHITLTEGGLFLFSIFRACWFIAFGVENANYSYYFSDKVWTTIFVMMGITHLIGFFIKSMCLRITSVYMSAFVWGTLTTLALLSRTNAPAVPSLLPLMILSVCVVVRLTADHKKRG